MSDDITIDDDGDIELTSEGNEEVKDSEDHSDIDIDSEVESDGSDLDLEDYTVEDESDDKDSDSDDDADIETWDTDELTEDTFFWSDADVADADADGGTVTSLFREAGA